MSVSAFSPTSPRSQALATHQAAELDLRQSFALTSVTGCSALGASTVSYGYVLQVNEPRDQRAPTWTTSASAHQQ